MQALCNKVNDNGVFLINITKKQSVVEKFHFILVIDSQNFAPYLKYIFHNMTLTIWDMINSFESISLIETYPIPFIRNITANNLFTEFRKITLQIDKADSEMKQMLVLLKMKVNQIRSTDPSTPIKIIMLRRDSANYHFNSYQKLVNKILDHSTLIKIVSLFPDNKDVTFYHNNVQVISNSDLDHLFFLKENQFGLKNLGMAFQKNKKVKINKGFIVGSDNNMISKDTFLVRDLDQEQELIIFLPNKSFLVDLSVCIQADDFKILEGIRNSISHNITFLEDYSWIKEHLIKLISTKEVNPEVKNRAICIYDKLKDSLGIIREKFLKEKFQTKEWEEHEKFLLEFAKRSPINLEGAKYQHMLDQATLRNIGQFDLSNKIKAQLEKPQIQEFIDGVDEEAPLYFNESIEFFNSGITLSDWFEEFQDGGAIGLLIKVSTTPLAKLGINQNISVENITTTFLPILDYIDGAINFFNDKTNLSFGNLNKKDIVKGTAIGNSNAVIPLYINKYHWSISKLYLPYILGMIISHNPFCYKDSHQKFLFSLLIEMSIKSYCNDCANLSEKWVRCFVAVNRTCAQISFDNKYNYGIARYIDLYLTDPTKRIFNQSYAYDIIIGQILSTGYKLEGDKLVSVVKYILEECIRKCSGQTDPNDVILYPKEILESIENDIQYDLKLLISFIKTHRIFHKIYEKVGGYNSYIKLLETRFGVMPDPEVNLIFEEMKKGGASNGYVYSFQDLYTELGSPYDVNEICWYIYQGSRQFKNKIRINSIKSGDYVDIQLQSINMKFFPPDT